MAASSTRRSQCDVDGRHVSGLGDGSAGDPLAPDIAGDFSSLTSSAFYDRAAASVGRAFDPRHPACELSFQVLNVQDGRASILFELPVGLTRAFTALLESLHGFFRLVDYQSRIKGLDVALADPAEQLRCDKLQDDFKTEVCRLFDQFSAQGLEAKDAVKRTNLALKAKKHPWASHAMVRDVLSASGRFRKGGGIKKP